MSEDKLQCSVTLTRESSDVIRANLSPQRLTIADLDRVIDYLQTIRGLMADNNVDLPEARFLYDNAQLDERVDWIDGDDARVKACIFSEATYYHKDTIQGCVYVFSHPTTHHFKMGYTKDLRTRTKAFFHKMGRVPVNLIIVGVCESPRVLERIMHKNFEHKRVGGEWFALDASDIAYLKSLAGGV